MKNRPWLPALGVVTSSRGAVSGEPCLGAQPQGMRSALGLMLFPAEGL